MPLKSYRQLDVWQRAMDVVIETYALTRCIPDAERFGLVSQMRRAAVSIPSNIAEGYARKHRGDYVRHLSIAAGSLAELETQLTVLVRLEYITRDAALPLWNLLQATGQMLQRLIQSLESSAVSEDPEDYCPPAEASELPEPPVEF